MKTPPQPGPTRLPRALSTLALILLVGCDDFRLPLEPGESSLFVGTSNSATVFSWVRQFGTPGGDAVDAVAVTGTGVYVAGYTTSSLSGHTSAGNIDLFIQRYDRSDGTEIWTRQTGSSGLDRARGISVDDAGVYIAGFTSGTLPGQTAAGGDFDAFARKFTLDGNEIWTRQFGTSSTDIANGVLAYDDGVYVVGYTREALPDQTSAGGSSDAFLRKYDVDGNELWTRQFGTAGGDVATGISADASGVYASGSTTGTFPGQAKQGVGDGFVRKFDFTGNEIWTRQFGVPLASIGRVAITSAGVGGAYLAGVIEGGAFPGETYAGFADGFARKYDEAGAEIWTRQFGTAGVDEVNGVTNDGTSLHVFGFTSGTFPGQSIVGSNDAFIRSYDLAGNETRTLQFGTPVHDVLLGASAYGGEVYVGGGTGGELTGEGHAGDIDAFVGKVGTGPTVDALIGGMISKVEGLVAKRALNRGQGTALTVKLEGAIQKAARGNNKAASNDLRAFTNQVNAFISAGRLSNAQGQPLIDGAREAIERLLAS